MRQLNMMRHTGSALLLVALGWACEDNDIIADQRTEPLLADSGASCSGENCEDDEGPPFCGDLVLNPESGEQCEPPSVGDCDWACRRVSAACGDGVLGAGEECDDGNRTSLDGCSESCVKEACGNLRLDPGEECEPPGSASCSPTCKRLASAACGNGQVESGEACEPPGSATCDAHCQNRPTPTTAVCGDRVTQAPEECDDGNVAPGDRCGATCLLEVCGNGRQDFGENCDPPNNVGCAANCTLLVCGDGIVSASLGEECEDGNNVDGHPVSGDGCSAACKVERCGNGLVEADEQCEPPDTPTCDKACKRIVPIECGNGVHQPPEECDDGGKVPGDGCDALCRTEVCGNNRVDSREQCDPPTTGTCDTTCKFITSRCGDRVRNAGEECDDGNNVPRDGCNEICQLEACGNGRVDFDGECEPKDTSSCSIDCRPIVPECGDGKIEGLEQCEDLGQPPVSGDGCSDTCRLE